MIVYPASLAACAQASAVELMRSFRCYFIDECAATKAWRSIGRDAAEAAQQHALGLLAGYPTATIVELWEGADLVFRYSRAETPQTSTELRRLCTFAITAAEQEVDVALKRAIAWGAASLASQADALERRALGPDRLDPQNVDKP